MTLLSFSSRLVGLSVTVAAGTASIGAHAADPVTVVVSGSGPLAGTAYIAKQLGYFEQQGLDVSIVDGGGGSNAVNTLVGGGAQIGIVGIKLMSQAVGKGQSLKAVGTAIQGFPNYVVVQRAPLEKSTLNAASPFAVKAAYLKGKTVAVNDIGGSSGQFMRYTLRAASIPAEQVTLINMTSSAARLAALKRGRIDAIVGGQPEPETAEAGHYGVLLVNPKTDLPSIGTLDYMVQAVRADYLNDKPQIVEKYLRGIAQSEAFIHAHPDDAKRAYYAYIASDTHGAHVAPAIADAAWKNMLPYFPATLRLNAPNVAAARQFFDIPATLTDAVLLDNTVADRVVAALGGQGKL
jgi:NitT/TauT family transport system substrate-binding protein